MKPTSSLRRSQRDMFKRHSADVRRGRRSGASQTARKMRGEMYHLLVEKGFAPGAVANVILKRYGRECIDEVRRWCTSKARDIKTL